MDKRRATRTRDEVIIVDDSSKAAAILAQASMGYPASKLTNLAVTGTNGKTTVAFLVRSCIQNTGQKCGLIGTIVYDTGQASFEASLTTPDCLAIAEKQSQMLKAGSKYMVIEASSHALAQNRLAAIDFKAAAFTNLTGDHLDYHKTKEEYLAAKTKLFTALSPDATAVLNKQSPQAKHIAEKTKARVLWYAIDEPADIVAHIQSMDMNGTVFTLELANRSSVVCRPSSIVRTLCWGCTMSATTSQQQDCASLPASIYKQYQRDYLHFKQSLAVWKKSVGMATLLFLSITPTPMTL